MRVHRGLQILPRCLNSIIVAGEKAVTGSNKAPEPYAVVTVGALRSAYTSVAARSHSPQWNERFKIPVAGRAQHITFQVKVWILPWGVLT